MTELQQKLQTIEEGLRALPLLHIDSYDKELSFEEFVSTLVLRLRSHDTFEGTAMQCRRGRNRSFGDLYRITLSYYNVSFEKFLHHLLSSLNEENNTSYFYCPDIKSRVTTSIPKMLSSYVSQRLDMDELGISFDELHEICPHSHVTEWESFTKFNYK